MLSEMSDAEVHGKYLLYGLIYVIPAGKDRDRKIVENSGM